VLVIHETTNQSEVFNLIEVNSTIVLKSIRSNFSLLIIHVH
jgi:hypothetical protein